MTGAPLHGAVAATRRRIVCQYVADADGVVPLEDPATHVLREERTGNAKPLTESEVTQQVGIELHHHHLPRLAHADVLNYDPGQRLVQDGPELQPALELIQTTRSSAEDALQQ